VSEASKLSGLLQSFDTDPYVCTLTNVSGTRQHSALALRQKQAVPHSGRPSALVSAQLFFWMACAGLGGLRSLAILDATLVSKVAAFLGLSLTFWGIAVFVHFFFNETGAFLNFSFDAHFVFLSIG
jgi:hypothetical protein